MKKKIFMGIFLTLLIIGLIYMIVVNTVFNFKKNKSSKNIIFSGTGFYIRGYLIEKWGSYPFHSLTEDYELSIYATVNNLTTYYNINSIFYDEQPMKFKDTINQRTRWIRGYFDVRKLYTKQLIKKIKKDNCNYGSIIDETFGIIPYVFIILGLILWFFQILFNLIYNLFIHNDFYKTSLLELIIFIFFIYFILVLNI